MAGEVDEWTRCRAQARGEFLGSLRQDVASLHAIFQSRQALLHAQATGAHPAGWPGPPFGLRSPRSSRAPTRMCSPGSADYRRWSTTCRPPYLRFPLTGRPSRCWLTTRHPHRGCPTGPGAAGPCGEGPKSRAHVLPVPTGAPRLAALPTSAEPPNLTGDVKTVHVYQTTTSAKSRAGSGQEDRAQHREVARAATC